ncbi:hypothetical protein JD844_001682 [Phrynosoma platyrhinos]|uniref:G-protein coupled receptors family 3 profile domain-containing protein n=1 Tax=Phrynosoma platyrhinos TaxID=52577 RepID=A0ABQ7TAP0_PHRPL|nr:hypothetical protein JD844_001682 [Phrynosoma platyrhinos]
MLPCEAAMLLFSVGSSLATQPGSREEGSQGDVFLHPLPAGLHTVQWNWQASAAAEVPSPKSSLEAEPYTMEEAHRASATGETVKFSENGELVTGFDVTNWIMFPNQTFARVIIGNFDPEAPLGKMLNVHDMNIVWPRKFNQVLPISMCNDYCRPGYRKKRKEGEPFCCYDCVPCPEGKISYEKDINSCDKCPEDQYANLDQDRCIPKALSYLSFEEPLGITLSFTSIAFAVTTAFTLGTFVRYQDTPIVKANNRNLTYMLLTSLLLCFLSSLLFIGEPKDITCLLRQTLFSIIFSVALSSLLAKTITVVLAFMAAKPGSGIRKWLGKKLANIISVRTSHCSVSDPLPISHEIYQPGDLVIGEITSQIFHLLAPTNFNEEPSPKLIKKAIMMPKNYKHVLALVFAVKEINENPIILPNVTLGFHIYDNYCSPEMTYMGALSLLSTQHRFYPNYNCAVQNALKAVIGGFCSGTSLYMATILNSYKIPQLIYGCLDSSSNENLLFTSLYKMVPNQAIQCTGIVQLLLHFRWTWVGLFMIDDDNGERFLQEMESVFFSKGICFAFVEKGSKWTFADRMLDLFLSETKKMSALMQSKTNVFVVYGASPSILNVRWNLHTTVLDSHLGKVWLITPHWEFRLTTFNGDGNMQLFHGAISLSIHSNEPPGFRKFLQNYNPFWTKEDSYINDFWEQAFRCSLTNYTVQDGQETKNICTGKEKLENLPQTYFEMSMTGHSYNVYNAAHAIAHALHNMTHLLKSVSFNNNAGETVQFGDNGELVTGFDIINWVTFPNQSFVKVRVGRVDSHAPQGKELTIQDESIVWHRKFNQVLPISVCNENCHPGYSRIKKKGKPFCCFDCIPCPERQISSHKDMNTCVKCPEDQYTNWIQDECIPKVITYLSYEEPLGITLTLSAVTFAMITALVLGIFVKNHDTPIVRANNRTLTYILLISLFLCFLCSLLFIGKPKEMSCLLRQTAFSIIFSIALSSLLAKTITVVLAFMATKPGTRLRNYKANDVLHTACLKLAFATVLCMQSDSLQYRCSVPKNYQHILALAFAINEINENPKILPNLTLGFHILNSYYEARMTYKATLSLLATQHKFVPSFKCHNQNNLIAIIGACISEISANVAILSAIHKIPQLHYFLSNTLFNNSAGDTVHFDSNGELISEFDITNWLMFPNGSVVRMKVGRMDPWALPSPDLIINEDKIVWHNSFSQMVPNETQQYRGVVQLLQHFKWTWIGLAAVDDDKGDRFLQVMEMVLSQNGICTAFTVRILQWAYVDEIIDLLLQQWESYNIVIEKKANVIFVYGEPPSYQALRLLLFAMPFLGLPPLGKVWIVTSHWDFASLSLQKIWDLQSLHGSISFTVHSNQPLGFQEFIHMIRPSWAKEDGFIQDFWEQAFDCSLKRNNRHEENKHCSGEEELKTLPGTLFEMKMTGHSYNIYNAVYAVAHALHAIHESSTKHGSVIKGARLALSNVPLWLVHHFLRSILFNNSAGETVCFNENRELITRFDVTNWLMFANGSIARVTVGQLNPQAPPDQELTINDEQIVLPRSVCNDNCYPGYSKKKKEGEAFCCYDCIPCPEGMISNQKGETRYTEISRNSIM